MGYDGELVLEFLARTHQTTLLTDREKHLVGLAVTITRGCQVSSTARSNCLRAGYRRRSIGVEVRCNRASRDEHLTDLGMVERAISPRISGRVGTSRQPQHLEFLRAECARDDSLGARLLRCGKKSCRRRAARTG